jgi:hypothetical protein
MFDRLQMIHTVLVWVLIAIVWWQVAFACAMDFLKSGHGKRFEGNLLGLYFATLFTGFVGPILLVLLGACYIVFAPYFVTRWILRHLP